MQFTHPYLAAQARLAGIGGDEDFQFEHFNRFKFFLCCSSKI